MPFIGIAVGGPVLAGSIPASSPRRPRIAIIACSSCLSVSDHITPPKRNASDRNDADVGPAAIRAATDVGMYRFLGRRGDSANRWYGTAVSEKVAGRRLGNNAEQFEGSLEIDDGVGILLGLAFDESSLLK